MPQIERSFDTLNERYLVDDDDDDGMMVTALCFVQNVPSYLLIFRLKRLINCNLFYGSLIYSIKANLYHLALFVQIFLYIL